MPETPPPARLRVVGGPLARHKLAILRDERTRQREFRAAMRELSLLLVGEATREMPTKKVGVRTPLAESEAEGIPTPVCLVPILRAGLGMLDGALALLPEATVGFMGLFRNEGTAEPVEYYVNLPDDLGEYLVLVLDPMLATGGSLSATLSKLKELGATWVSCACAVAAEAGVQRIGRGHPDVSVYVAAVDPELDDNAFIVPGLGDAGDRLYGTL